jgi:hypothetical protein
MPALAAARHIPCLVKYNSLLQLAHPHYAAASADNVSTNEGITPRPLRLRWKWPKLAHPATPKNQYLLINNSAFFLSL